LVLHVPRARRQVNSAMARSLDVNASTRPAEAAGQPVLEVHGLSKVYETRDARKEAIREVGFAVRPREFLSIVGPSGAGKTTLLRCLTGLLEPTSGTVHFEGAEITEPPSKMALVFQDYGRSLFPWLTVAGNVSLPLRGKGIPREQRAARVARALEAVGLPDVARRYPWQLSGGMQQRVALARALAYGPDCLVMDEPFASVDAQTRFDLEDLVLRLQADLGVTVVFVTHDIDEAVYLSDRVVVLTSSPAEVRSVLDIGLDRPRDQVATRRDPEFADLRTTLFELVRQPGNAERRGG
jgi:NitT/TauT family transport system ATP-binding protein